MPCTTKECASDWLPPTAAAYPVAWAHRRNIYTSGYDNTTAFRAWYKRQWWALLVEALMMVGRVVKDGQGWFQCLVCLPVPVIRLQN